MVKIITVCLSTLALLLPWHGAITVFLPDYFRFWKEGVVLVLLLLVIFHWLKFITNYKQKPSESSLKREKLSITKFLYAPFFKGGVGDLKNPILWSILFLLWSGCLVFVDQNYYSVLSARYLGFGFLVFILISLLVQNLGKSFKQVFQQFSNIFITSSAFSVLFGTWGKFGGGFEVLQNFYSTTISSWVPGQTIPLYHQTSGGLIRMQGGASGPVEFGHLLFVAVFLVISGLWLVGSGKEKRHIFHYLLIIILLFGLWQSGSRAALGGGVLLLVFYLIKNYELKIKSSKKLKAKDYRLLADQVLKYSKILLVTICSVVILKIVLLGLLPKEIQSPPIAQNSSPIIFFLRLSDSAHFTRPVQALKDGFAHPLAGNLGSYGPAARARNLAQNNDDSAPIAENIFADYFVQMGMIGFIFAVGFWFTLFFLVRGFSRVFVGISFLLVNMATLFDMTPLSLIFFTVFAFLSTKYSK